MRQTRNCEDRTPGAVSAVRPRTDLALRVFAAMSDVAEIAEDEATLFQATCLMLVDVAGWAEARVSLTNCAPGRVPPHAERHSSPLSVSLPLSWRGDVHGKLTVFAPECCSFDDDSVALLREVARSLSSATSSLRTREGLRQIQAERASEACAKEAKDEFFASMSHELRTPLGAVLGVSEALQEGVYGAISEAGRGALKRLDENGKYLLALVNDVLDVAKLEAGQTLLDAQPVTIDDVCRASLRIIQSAAAKKALSVTLDIPACCDAILADEQRLVQVLVNLLGNAVKFTPHGGSIGIEVDADRAQGLRLTVWDDGVGIAPGDLARLFQPFVQVDASLTRRHAGTGLGLALVRKLVELHGGRVEVTSTPGLGSRFSIVLPNESPSRVGTQPC